MKNFNKKENLLKYEKSPYLLQHASNKIWWYPWGQEAFAAAKRENKPIFLSIGYSSCYWCHFMEKDSFEKDDVAEILNKFFIAIKVDREERPDVDSVYMSALLAMRGSGGWPMSMFLTPEGVPFYGASTIRHDDFVRVLNEIGNAWLTQSEEIRSGSKKILNVLDQYLDPEIKKQEVNGKLLDKFFYTAVENFDEVNAGFGHGNKFPRPHVLRFLLRYYKKTGKVKSLEMVVRTLKKMAHSGLHDILGGGFHRYSVDAQWQVPHFEKMLYDNAGLAIAYLEAYQVTGDDEFRFISKKTLDWVLANMTSPDGGFFSSIDAGDFGEEGEFYSWSYDELKKLLSNDDFDYLKTIFDITEQGNFDNGRIVLNLNDGKTLPDETLDKRYKRIRKTLLSERKKRKPPRIDDKIITAWNGFMISALARAYRVIGDERYLTAAEKASDFILKNLRTPKGELLRRFRDGDASKRSTLNDYAFLIDGLIELYQADFNERWIDTALELQTLQDKIFLDDEKGGYFLDDGTDKMIPLRSKDYDDMAMPSGNAVAALNLLKFNDFTYNENYKKTALSIFESIVYRIDKSPFAYPHILSAIDYYLSASKEVAVIKKSRTDDTKEVMSVLNSKFLPNIVIATGTDHYDGNLTLLKYKKAIDGKPTVYVCSNGSCKLPVNEPSEILSQIQ